MRAIHTITLIVLLFSAILSQAIAGPVVVRKSSDEVEIDAFAIRDQLLKQHEWQQQVRLQQQLTILSLLPNNCRAILWPYKYFACGDLFYRPYRYQQQDVFIKIPEPPPAER